MPVNEEPFPSNAVTSKPLEFFEKPLASAGRKHDFTQRLPVGWKNTLEENDQQWIGKNLFLRPTELAHKLDVWWYPPHLPGPDIKCAPAVGSYYHKRLFLWMPRRMWAFDFKCPSCPPSKSTSLTSKGLYNRVRNVIDLKDRYYLAAEYLECPTCKKTFISYDTRLMDQLPDDLRIRFPVVLTRKFACDKAVVSLMRARTVGNSPTALCGDIHELHSEEWMQRTVTYLSDCQRHKKMLAGMKCVSVTYDNPPSFKTPPTYKWFLAVYVRDVWSRLPTLKASLTSVYGSILKIDSTKKITRKLQGKAASSASWCTNVGNERGEVLLSLLTTSESLSNLEKMAEGLMNRYANANQADPVVLYTDRDCCKSRGEKSKYQVLFHRWEKLRVRLDCWHFMRRLSTVCSNESHPLYGTFMKKISAAIFEWEPTDVEALRKAKRNELLLTGIKNPSPETVNRAVKKTELARHCRRRTRGKEKTIQSIESVLLSLRNSTDCLGVPLFRDGAMDVWNVEKIHVECIQDPEDVQLYTKVGDLLKGGVSLPVFRCGRGTTSLESFHCHLKNFIPGKPIQKNVVNW